MEDRPQAKLAKTLRSWVEHSTPPLSTASRRPDMPTSMVVSPLSSSDSVDVIPSVYPQGHLVNLHSSLPIELKDLNSEF